MSLRRDDAGARRCRPPSRRWCSAATVAAAAAGASAPSVSAVAAVAREAAHNFTVGPEVSDTMRRLQAIPRGFRPRLLRRLLELPEEAGGLGGGLTSAAYKCGLVELLRASSWATASVIEIGALRGHISSIVSPLVGLVYAVDLYWSISRGSSAGRFRDVPNVVQVTADSSRPFALEVLSGNRNFRAAIIDGDHDAKHVFLDTFMVLHDLPCCVEVVAYHDYCDDVVHSTISLFVAARLLEYRQPLGDTPGTYWWCKDGRPEGAIFDVVRQDAVTFRERLWKLYRQEHLKAAGLEGTARNLRGTSWMMPRQNLQLILELPPRPVSVVQAPEQRSLELGYAELTDSVYARTHPRWGGRMPSVVLRSTADLGGADCGMLLFDARLTGVQLGLNLELASFEEACPAAAALAKLWPPSEPMVGVRSSYAAQLSGDVYERLSHVDGDARALAWTVAGGCRETGC